MEKETVVVCYISCEETGEIIYSGIYFYDFEEFNSACKFDIKFSWWKKMTWYHVIGILLNVIKIYN